MLLNVGPTHDGRIMPIFEEIVTNRFELLHYHVALIDLVETLLQVNGLRSVESVFMDQFHESIKMTLSVPLSGEYNCTSM